MGEVRRSRPFWERAGTPISIRWVLDSGEFFPRNTRVAGRSGSPNEENFTITFDRTRYFARRYTTGLPTMPFLPSRSSASIARERQWFYGEPPLPPNLPSSMSRQSTYSPSRGKPWPMAQLPKGSSSKTRRHLPFFRGITVPTWRLEPGRHVPSHSDKPRRASSSIFPSAAAGFPSELTPLARIDPAELGDSISGGIDDRCPTCLRPSRDCHRPLGSRVFAVPRMRRFIDWAAR